MRIIIIIVGLLLMSSCIDHRSKNATGKVFRYNESSGISSLDPAFANDQAKIWACNHLFNGLIQLDEMFVPRPCIAKSWRISKDGKTYTFNLRNDVYFHDDPLIKKSRTASAYDFVYSFNRVIDKKTASPGAWVFNYIYKDENGTTQGLYAADDSTLVIHLSNPFPPFLGLLGMPYCAVVPKEVVEHYGKDFRTHPVGTGPFRFWQWIERTALILHKNENYFERDEQGRKMPFLDAVVVNFISDKQSAFLEFIKGKLDFLSGLDASFKDDLLTRNGMLRPKYSGKFHIETGPNLNTEYLGFLQDGKMLEESPLKDVRIRKAINYGFDRRKMIDYLRNGMGTPGVSGFVPMGLQSFDSSIVTGYDYNPGKARMLLKEAGYPEGKGLPAIVMSTTPTYQDICEYMQGQLSEIGIKINLEMNQAVQHRQMVARQQLLFFRGSWVADYADAENYLSLFYSRNFAPNGPNYTHFKSEEYDKLYESSMQTTNDSLRFIIYRKMDQLIIDQAPLVVLYYDRILRLYQNNIHGLRNNALNLLTLKNVEKY